MISSMVEESTTRRVCIRITANLTRPGIPTLSKLSKQQRSLKKKLIRELKKLLLPVLLVLKHHKKLQDALSTPSFPLKEDLMLLGLKPLKSQRVKPLDCLAAVKDLMHQSHHLKKARLLHLSRMPLKRAKFP